MEEYRNKTTEELKEEVKKLKQDSEKLRQDLMLGKTNKSSEIGFIRKKVARIQTVLREKEIIDSLNVSEGEK